MQLYPVGPERHGWKRIPLTYGIGLSQTYGPWYEGKTPYKHVVWFNINENMGATGEEIRKMGFANENKRGKDALTEKRIPSRKCARKRADIAKGDSLFSNS